MFKHRTRRTIDNFPKLSETKETSLFKFQALATIWVTKCQEHLRSPDIIIYGQQIVTNISDRE